MIENFQLFKKYYDFQLWLIPTLNKFPKNQKYTLAEKIQNQSIKVLDIIIQIAQNHERIKATKKADLELKKLKILIRLSKDLKLLTFEKYEHSSKKLVEIGKILGGIIKLQQEKVHIK
ncbi:MAG: diversity-generating retroelement protein Avd [Candidatus Woesearchaeota archaeon]